MLRHVLLLPMPLAAGTAPAFLGPMVALLGASVVIAYLCHRLRLVPIAGFLLAGVLIGPRALGLVDDEGAVAEMAEVGVMLLLFTIGVEFSLERLARLRRAILVGGGLQVALTLGGVAAFARAFGVPWGAALFTGGLVALSSTAIVLSLLDERRETDTPAGRMSLAILLFQDFAVIGFVLFLPLLGGRGDVGATLAGVGRALVVLAVVAVVARKVVPPLLERVAAVGRPEVFLLAVVALCFGTAWVVALAGVSVALGAFLAGLVVSESRHSEQALADVLPLRAVFNAVFFVSVGMLLDVRFVAANPGLIAVAVAGVLALKVLTSGVAVAALGYPVRVAVAVALGLAGIGEFSFVLATAGAAYGLRPLGSEAYGEQTFIAVTVALMLATPLLVKAGPRVGAWLGETPLGRLGARLPEAPSQSALSDHVVLVGYGPAGERIATVLREEAIPFALIEMNPELHARALREAGAAHAIRGDASRRAILEAAGVPNARLVCVATNDPASAAQAVRLARALAPSAQIVARTRFGADVDTMRAAGADVVVPEELETSMRLVAQVLGAYLVPSSVIEHHTRTLRAGDYQILRGSIQEAHLMVLQGLDEAGLHTRAARVAPGSPADGKTLADLDLRRRVGLAVIAVQRSGHTEGSPGGDFRLRGGDRLVLIGPPMRFADGAEVFRAPG